MRSTLLESPRLITLARSLRTLDGFSFWSGMDHGALRNVTDTALRYVALALLLRFWSAAREYGHFRGSDLLLDRLAPCDVDEIVGIKGFGDALVTVGWATPSEHGLILPNFKEHNVPRSNAERQRDHRRRKALQAGSDDQRVTKSNGARVTHSNGARVTDVTHNREEKNNTPPLPPNGGNGAAVDHFAEFWSAYPRKTAKQAALKAWGKLAPSAELVAAILAAVARQKRTDAWLKDDGRFIPHPASWLNGRRWEDEVIGPPTLFSPPTPPEPPKPDNRQDVDPSVVAAAMKGRLETSQ